MDKKKKAITIGISVVVSAGIIGGGIWMAVQSGKKAVKVASVANMNSGGWDNSSEIYDYGRVTTNANQDIYYDSTLTVTDVYVKEGDTVKIGDRLVAYDTSLASLELEMKQMQIKGIELNIQNLQAEVKQLKGTKVASAGRSTEELAQMTAKGTRPGVKTLASQKDGEENPDKSEDPENPENPDQPENPETPDKPSVGTKFPEELKGKPIYESITLDCVPYNEDGEGTSEKPYRYLCAPGATVNAQFMLKMLEDQTVCAFDVVDNAKEPTLLLYSWILDGKTGQIVKPEEPQEPDEPNEPEDPDDSYIPDDSDDWDDSGISDAPTKEEVQNAIQEKEKQIKELDLDRRTAELELKQLNKKVDNGIVTSTVEGTVKSVLDEETAKLENKPMISVVGEDGFYVSGGVAESAYDKIEEGMTATVTSWNTGMTYDATITGVSNTPMSSSFQSSNNVNMSYYPFTAVIKGEADLSDGEAVSISVDGISSEMENAIYLDQMFVREEGNKYYVYKKGENGKLQKQYVEIGKNLSGSLEIVSGITEEDEIAFPYGRDVKEGARTKSVDSLYDYN